MVKETNGIAKFRQYMSRGSGAQSVSQSVGFLLCWVCAQTDAPQRDLNERKATGKIDLGSLIIFWRSNVICTIQVKVPQEIRKIHVLK